MTDKTISWDDWRVVDAIATAGTTARAASILHMNQSTVFRRITQLEEQLGVRLFERHARGFQLTPSGESVLDEVRQMRSITNTIERKITGLDERPVGDVTLSISGTILRLFLTDLLFQFRTQYPDINLRLNVTDQVVNVADREADVVIRGSNDPDPQLFGRRMGRLRFAIYTGSNADREALTERYAKDPDALEWVGWEGAMAATTPGQWFNKTFGHISTSVAADDVDSIAHLVAAGFGCSLLPLLIGDQHPGVIRISEPLARPFAELWTLTHADLRRTTRVSALLRFLADRVGERIKHY